MRTLSSLRRRSVAGLALTAAGLFTAAGAGSLAAQAPPAGQPAGPCALLKTDEVQSLANKNVAVSEGVAASISVIGSSTCSYAWGAGAERYTLDVTVNDAARVFPGLAPAAVGERVHAAITGSAPASPSLGIGDVSVYKEDSPLFVHATSFLKGRILQVQLGGIDAIEKKDQVISLLTTAASRL